MHILLTDILACPVCGPPFGLIVLSDTVRERRVLSGALGCPNCENRFPIRDAVAHLEAAAATESARTDTAAMSEETGTTVTSRDTESAGGVPGPDFAVRLAALLGLDRPGGFVLVAGPAAALTDAVAQQIEDVEIVADARYAEGRAISRLRLGERLPFYAGKLRGIWLSGDAADAWLEEAARVLHPTGRLVLAPPPTDHADRLAGAGLRILAEEAGTVLASKA
jgi:uncharacterized protein YbaR (Trm112 family)